MDFMTMIKLKEQHNRLTKDPFNVYSLGDFENYVLGSDTFDQNYIEIPSHQTNSGHAEILELY